MTTKTAHNSIDGYYLFASSLAGLVARTITHPMDTIKTRLQATTIATTKQILQNTLQPSKALISLYRGLPVTLFFSVPSLSIYLSTYEFTKQTLVNHNVDRSSAYSHLISGCAAEVAAGLLFTPMEVLKNRLQVATEHHQRSTMSLVSQIFKTEGIRGFFKGYWMGLVVFVPHSMVYFMTYEELKSHLLINYKSNSAGVYLLCSSIAGITSITISTPLDIIKTRWQISAAEQGAQFRQGPLAIARHMLLVEGKGAFTRGLWARVAWGLPTTAISMTVFEVLKENRDTISQFLVKRS